MPSKTDEAEAKLMEEFIQIKISRHTAKNLEKVLAEVEKGIPQEERAEYDKCEDGYERAIRALLLHKTLFEKQASI